MRSMKSQLLLPQRNNGIHSTVVMLMARDTYGTKDTAEAVGTDLVHQAGVNAVQVLIDIGSTEHLACFALTRQAVVAEEELLDRLMSTEAAVALLDVAHLIGGELVAFALGKQVHALGIELRMVYRGVHINHLTDVEAEETAATALIGEQGVTVAGADERGDAWQCGALLGIGLAHAQRGHLHEILQRALLGGRVAVILVEIDEQAIDQSALALALGREVKVVGIEHPQLGRQQQTTEGALMHSLLLAHEDRCYTVGIEGIIPTLRLAHQGKQPTAEIAHHGLILGEATHQGAQTILPIPLRQRTEIVRHGMIGCYVHRLGCYAHTLGPPHVVSIGLEVGHPRLVDALGDGSERCIAPLRTVFRLLGEHIVAQVVLLAQQGLDVWNGEF